jgi:ADP-dependent NAD(P)H-hydrate dehydratase / NAD(P)H-hydrate epimerase
MWILNSDEMKSADKKTIEELGVPGMILMENAGIAVVNVLDQIIEDVANTKFLIVCGRGNNGGDGFVVARHLLRREANVEVLLIGQADQLKGDALANYNMFRIYSDAIHEIKDANDFNYYKELLHGSDVIIDALFGTGLTKPLTDMFAIIVEEISKQQALIVSIDIPSGLSSDTGEIIGPCVFADITVTLAAPKWCHIFSPAEQACGEVFIADIGIPEEALRIADPCLKVITEEDIQVVLQDREPDTHKKDYGDILILAGSPGKIGASYMTAVSALKS